MKHLNPRTNHAGGLGDSRCVSWVQDRIPVRYSREREGQWPLGKPCHFAGCKTARANATSRLVTRRGLPGGRPASWGGLCSQGATLHGDSARFSPLREQHSGGDPDRCCGVRPELAMVKCPGNRKTFQTVLPVAVKIAATTLRTRFVIGERAEKGPEKAKAGPERNSTHALKPGWTEARPGQSAYPCSPSFSAPAQQRLQCCAAEGVG